MISRFIDRSVDSNQSERNVPVEDQIRSQVRIISRFVIISNLSSWHDNRHAESHCERSNFFPHYLDRHPRLYISTSPHLSICPFTRFDQHQYRPKMSSFVARMAALAGRNVFHTRTAAAAAATAIATVAGTSVAMADKNERSYIMLKPDAVQRGLVGEIITRFEKRGFKLVALKLVTPTLEHAQKHYYDLAERPFFPTLCKFLSSGPVVAMVFEGEDVIRQG